MNEGKLTSEMERGHKADLLMKNELLQEAFQTLENEFTTAWKQTTHDQVVERDRLYNLCQALDSLKSYLASMAQNGRLAENQLNQIRGKK